MPAGKNRFSHAADKRFFNADQDVVRDASPRRQMGASQNPFAHYSFSLK